MDQNDEDYGDVSGFKKPSSIQFFERIESKYMLDIYLADIISRIPQYAAEKVITLNCVELYQIEGEVDNSKYGIPIEKHHEALHRGVPVDDGLQEYKYYDLYCDGGDNVVRKIINTFRLIYGEWAEYVRSSFPEKVFHNKVFPWLDEDEDIPSTGTADWVDLLDDSFNILHGEYSLFPGDFTGFHMAYKAANELLWKLDLEKKHNS